MEQYIDSNRHCVKIKPGYGKRALEKAGYLCQISQKHSTFTAKSTGLQYVEAHHLVPLKKQSDYKEALDVPENIVALCPNCHRRLHYAKALKEKKVLLKQLCTPKTIRELAKKNINVTLDQIYEYYK